MLDQVKPMFNRILSAVMHLEEKDTRDIDAAIRQYDRDIIMENFKQAQSRVDREMERRFELLDAEYELLRRRSKNAIQH